MKLTVKTLKGSQFEINVQPSDTVKSLETSLSLSLSVYINEIYVFLVLHFAFIFWVLSFSVAFLGFFSKPCFFIA